MSWLENVKKTGPYYAQGIFCTEYLEIYNNYELIITGCEEYQRLAEAQNQALVKMRIRIAEGTATEAMYNQQIIYFNDAIRDLIVRIEKEPLIINTIHFYKKKMNKVLKKNEKICIDISVPVPDINKIYTFKTYNQIAERLKIVKAKVDSFMGIYKK